VIEDTELTKNLISYIFGNNIANYVAALTRVTVDRKVSIPEMISSLWLQRKNNDLLLIKYFDRLHNLQTITFKPHSKIIDTIEETFKSFLSLSFYLKATNPDLLTTHETIIKLCYQQLGIKQLLSSILFDMLEDNFHLPSLIVQNVTPQTKIQ
jgi:(p)ppGpp synthase/HD superfamily hydrolase